jgi:hypothetical protein
VLQIHSVFAARAAGHDQDSPDNTPFRGPGQGRLVLPEKRGIQFVETRDLFKVRMIEQICYIENYKQRVLAQEGRVLSSADAAFEWIGKYASAFPDPGQPSQPLN